MKVSTLIKRLYNSLIPLGSSFHNDPLQWQDGTKEAGKYKNNALIASCTLTNSANTKKSRLFPMRSAKLKEQVGWDRVGFK